MSLGRLGARPTARRPQLKRQPRDSTRQHVPDYRLLIYMTLLLGLGAITVYSISPGIAASTGLSENYYSFKQLVAIGLGSALFLVASVVKVSAWKKFQIPLIVATMISIVLVRFLGDPINGAYRWLDIGGLSFQVAEIIKFTLILGLASYLGSMKQQQRMGESSTMKTLGIVMVLIVIVVAGLESDLGSAVVMVSIIGFMAFVAGLPFRKLFLASTVVMIIMLSAIAISPYRRDRVSTFLNPTADCQNEGYQACQALITVGSGGLLGKGLGRSVQAYGYLPEAANDSIFAIVSEKFGFIGATLTIGVFIGLFRRIKSVAQRASNEYSRLMVSGILAWLSVQMAINVGAMIGLLPLKGITLPFVSYGGTSVIFVMIAVGIVFQISRYTDLSKPSRARRNSGKSSFNESAVSRHSTNRKWGRA